MSCPNLQGLGCKQKLHGGQRTAVGVLQRPTVLHTLLGVRLCGRIVDRVVRSADKQTYIDEIKEEYAEIREEYYNTLIDKKWKTLAEVRPRAAIERTPSDGGDRHRKRSPSSTGASCRRSRLAGMLSSLSPRVMLKHWPGRAWQARKFVGNMCLKAISSPSAREAACS